MSLWLQFLTLFIGLNKCESTVVAVQFSPSFICLSSKPKQLTRIYLLPIDGIREMSNLVSLFSLI